MSRPHVERHPRGIRRVVLPAPGGGAPYLRYRIARGRSWVEAGEGTVRHGSAFRRALADEALFERLAALFRRSSPRLRSAAVLAGGDAHVTLAHVPPKVARRAAGIALGALRRALVRVGELEEDAS